MSFLHWRGRRSDASSSGVESGIITSAENSPDVIPGSPESVEHSCDDTPRSHRYTISKPRQQMHQLGSLERSCGDKIYVPESDEEILGDSVLGKEIIVESDGEVISDSGEESLPDINLIKNVTGRHLPSVMSPSSLSAEIMASKKLVDRLDVSGLSKDGRVVSSTPTHDTSKRQNSSIVEAHDSESDESPMLKGKSTKPRNVIKFDDSSDESDYEIPVYTRRHKSSSFSSHGQSLQKETEFDDAGEITESDDDFGGRSEDKGRISRSKSGSDSEESDHDVSQSSRESEQPSLESSIQNLSINETRGKTKSSNYGHDSVDISEASIEESPLLCSVKKKLINRIESDSEDSSIVGARNPVETSKLAAKVLSFNEDSYISVSSPQNGGKMTPVVSPEKDRALTPQEKYGHKFKIKKKTPQGSKTLQTTFDESKEELKIQDSSFPVSSPDSKKTLTPQEKYGHKFKIKKRTPQKSENLDKSMDKSFTDQSQMPLNQSSSSILDVSVSNQSLQSSFVVSDLTASEMNRKLKEKKKLLHTANTASLPDGGSKIRNQIKELEDALANLSVISVENTSINSQESVFCKNSSFTAGSFVKSPLDHNKSSSSVAIIESPRSPALPSIKELEMQLEKKKMRYSKTDLESLPDGGAKLRKKMALLEQEIARRKGSISEMYRFECGPKEPLKEPKGKEVATSETSSELESKKVKLEELKMIFRAANPRSLPDGGVRLKQRISDLEKDIMMLQLKANIEVKTSPNEVIKVEGPKMNYKQSKLTDFGQLAAVVTKTNQDSNRPPAAFNMEAMYEIAMDYGARNYGGKISSKREREMIKVTGEAVEDLHEALKNAPDTDEVEEDDPEGLVVNLMPHQKRALAWLLWRESQLPRGGILADDMGLGKTLTMISLMLRHRELVRNGTVTEDFVGLNESSQESGEEKPDEEEEKWLKKKNYVALPKPKRLVPSKGTLVVCPASLLGQWEGEVKRRVVKGKMKVLVYHGTNRDYDVCALAHYDIVITTYQLVMKEAFPSGKEAIRKSKDDVPKIKAQNQGRLFQVGWSRIVLDEAHQIRNHKSKTAQGVCLLRGGRRWVLTGTPVQNKEMDLYSLVRFLRVKPFDDYTCWKLQVSNNSAQGMRRLSLIVKVLMLRRTKDQIDVQTGKKLIELPEKKVVEHSLSLTQDEREVYDRIFTFSRSTLTQYMKSQEEREMEKHEKWGGSAGSQLFPQKKKDHSYTPTLTSDEGMTGEVRAHHLLILLLRLRQICCHPSLIKGMVETESKEADGLEHAEQDGMELDLVSQMAEMSLRATNDVEQEATEKIKRDVLTMDNPVFKSSSQSSKIERVIEELQNIRQTGSREKSVVVSQWTSMLAIVKEHLRDVGIRCHVISGQVLVKERTPIVEDFNSNPKGPKVLLLSLAAGGVGLNLVGANHLFLIDMHWNPQLEAQACDRIYRVGQTRPVTVHRFVVENTVEERILELQQKKLQLADEVLSGAKRTTNNKLTLEDMKTLFDVGKKDKEKFPS